MSPNLLPDPRLFGISIGTGAGLANESIFFRQACILRSCRLKVLPPDLRFLNGSLTEYRKEGRT